MRLAAAALAISAATAAASPPAGRDAWSPDAIRGFADYLVENGEYARAAAEYRRYLFVLPAGAGEEDVLYRIGRCHRLAGDSDRALETFKSLVALHPASLAAQGARCQIAAVHLGAGRHREAVRYADAEAAAGSAAAAARLRELTGIGCLLAGDWEDASRRLGEGGTAAGTGLSRRLAEIAARGAALPRKSPVAAGILSAIVPGAGKAYAGRVLDGLWSFALVGVCGWQSWEGFRRDGTGSGRGWAYGTVGAVLYFGNVYGAAVAAGARNADMRDGLLDEVRALGEPLVRDPWPAEAAQGATEAAGRRGRKEP